MRSTAHLATLLLLLWLLTSCSGTLAVGFEQTPTPDPAPAATLQALVNENEQLTVALATAVAPPRPRRRPWAASLTSAAATFG